MDQLQVGILIAGAVIPFLISLLKRWVKLSSELVSLLVIVVCFIIASAFELIESGFDFQAYIGRIATVYGVSQIIYHSVIKLPKLDTLIENEKAS